MPWPRHKTATINLARAVAVVSVVCVVGLANNARADKPAGAASGPVDFERDIQPILARRCHACHGPDVQESGLRLDSRTATLAGGQGGPAIVPGKSSQSRLIELITGAGDDKLVMPPEGQRLSSDEIARLRAWIDEGATWPEAIDPRYCGACRST